MKLQINTESIPEGKDFNKKKFELQWGFIRVIGKVNFCNPTERKISITIHSEGIIKRKKKSFYENIILFTKNKKHYRKFNFILKPKEAVCYKIVVDLQNVKTKIVPQEALSSNRFLSWVYWAVYNGSLIIEYDDYVNPRARNLWTSVRR